MPPFLKDIEGKKHNHKVGAQHNRFCSFRTHLLHNSSKSVSQHCPPWFVWSVYGDGEGCWYCFMGYKHSELSYGNAMGGGKICGSGWRGNSGGSNTARAGNSSVWWFLGRWFWYIGICGGRQNLWEQDGGGAGGSQETHQPVFLSAGLYGVISMVHVICNRSINSKISRL